mgnify:CR=1 FL=1
MSLAPHIRNIPGVGLGGREGETHKECVVQQDSSGIVRGTTASLLAS